MNKDIVYCIFKHLHFTEIIKVSIVCTCWYEASKSESLWDNIITDYIDQYPFVFLMCYTVENEKKRIKLDIRKFFVNTFFHYHEYDIVIRSTDNDRYKIKLLCDLFAWKLMGISKKGVLKKNSHFFCMDYGNLMLFYYNHSINVIGDDYPLEVYYPWQVVNIIKN